MLLLPVSAGRGLGMGCALIRVAIGLAKRSYHRWERNGSSPAQAGYDWPISAEKFMAHSHCNWKAGISRRDQVAGHPGWPPSRHTPEGASKLDRCVVSVYYGTEIRP